MIVCVCKAVSDRHIRAAVADGATRLKDLTRELGLGTCCGKCLPEAKSALAASLGQHGSGGSRFLDAPPFFAKTGTEFAV
jgi:bacterioferritin-associated ferredoxin